MGNSCHNWQIMVQVLVNFYDSEMYIYIYFFKARGKHLVRFREQQRLGKPFWPYLMVVGWEQTQPHGDPLGSVPALCMWDVSILPPRQD